MQLRAAAVERLWAEAEGTLPKGPMLELYVLVLKVQFVSLFSKFRKAVNLMNYCLFFQESRKIVIASWQYMVYNEFLPLLLGGRRMRKHGLKLKNKGYYYSRSSLLGL